jgi:hypothetical protein
VESSGKKTIVKITPARPSLRNVSPAKKQSPDDITNVPDVSVVLSTKSEQVKAPDRPRLRNIPFVMKQSAEDTSTTCACAPDVKPKSVLGRPRLKNVRMPKSAET